MRKTHLWRLLALILALVMVLGCLAGCDSNAGNDDDDDDDEVEELRDGLEKHEYDGLTFYLGKDFQEGKYDGESYWTDGDVYVVVDSDPLPDLYEDVDSVEELLDALVDDLKEGYDWEVEKGKANGTCYMVVEGLAVGLGGIGDLPEDATSVIGVYMEGDTMGLIGVMAEDFEKYEDDMILYATLGELEDYYKDEDPDDKDPDDENPDDKDPDDEPKKDLGPTQEHDLAGLHFRLPEGAEKTDGQDDDYAEFKYRGVEFDVTRAPLKSVSLDEPTAEAIAEDLYDLHDGDEYGKVELTSFDGVPVVTSVSGDLMFAIGVYVGGDFYWRVDATYDGRDVTIEELVRIVGSGRIEDDEVPTLVETTNEIVCEGLYLYMDKSYEVTGNGTVEVNATEGQDMLSVLRDENAMGETAEEILVGYQHLLETSGQYVERLERNGMGYLVYENLPGLTSLETFYVQGGILLGCRDHRQV